MSCLRIGKGTVRVVPCRLKPTTDGAILSVLDRVRPPAQLASLPPSHKTSHSFSHFRAFFLFSPLFFSKIPKSPNHFTFLPNFQNPNFNFQSTTSVFSQVGDAMSAVNITNVAILDNPAPFLSPFRFEISYECLDSLVDDIEWKLIYVGSAEDETYDQQLESVLVGPVNVGNYRFVLEADPPDPLKIREEDIIGVTVLLLTCSYLGQEFIRVGYYVNNDYEDEQLREESPQKVIIDKVQRNVLTDKPRVTKFPINFEPENGEHGGQPAEASVHATLNSEQEQVPPLLLDNPSE